MFHQTDKKWQVFAVYAFFIKREDEIILVGFKQIIGVFNPFRDTLARGHLTDVIGGDEGVEFVIGDFCIDRHIYSAASFRNSRGNLKEIDSSAVVTTSIVTIKRGRNIRLPPREIREEEPFEALQDLPRHLPRG